MRSVVIGLYLFSQITPVVALADAGLDCKNGTCAYTPLEPLPALQPAAQNGSDFLGYINGIIKLLIIIGAMLAVVRFSIGGIVYMTSEIAGVRAQAKSQMWASVWGLLLLISSVLILTTINPVLGTFKLSKDLDCLSKAGVMASNGNCILPSQSK